MGALLFPAGVDTTPAYHFFLSPQLYKESHVLGRLAPVRESPFPGMNEF